MSKILVIAEKPSVARNIAPVLGCNKRGDGFVYNDQYIVSWAIGHLVTLFEPDDYDPALKKWSMHTLPIIPACIKLKAVQSTIKQFDLLKKIMSSDEVASFICATDSGREGELIFRYIYTLIDSNKPFKRLWISSMTDKAIKEGFEHLKDGMEYDNLYYSAKCRSEADWLVGINASRAFTIQYKTLLSVGRVQTPTLAILVNRQKEIDTFVTTDYYEIIAYFDDYKGKWFSPTTNETKIFDQAAAHEIAARVRGNNGVVESIENEEKRTPPPLLYDLTELQRDCNKKYSFSAAKTLEVAQELYEKRKLITYPRTDSRYLSDDMAPKIKLTLTKLQQVSPYSDYINALDLSALIFTKRIIDNSKVTDHHAIIPTDVSINITGLSDEEMKVYDLIARRFICVFYPYYVYNVTKIITTAMNEKFLTKGNTIIQMGFMELYKEDKPQKQSKRKKAKTADNATEEDDDEETVLPNVALNQSVITKNTVVEFKKTTPPKTYTEATLLSAMENAGRLIEDEALKEQLKDSGLGTPATRAAIIERLLTIGYIERKAKALIPTEKGIKLIAVVPQELKSPETTGRWEKGLTSIARGSLSSEKFMSSINRYVNYIVSSSQVKNVSVVFPEEKRDFSKSTKKSLGKCPRCVDGEIFENSKAFFCSNWKNQCKFSIWKSGLSQYNLEVTPPMVMQLLKDKKIDNIDFTLPQTAEKATATLTLMENAMGALELINLTRQ